MVGLVVSAVFTAVAASTESYLFFTSTICVGFGGGCCSWTDVHSSHLPVPRTLLYLQ